MTRRWWTRRRRPADSPPGVSCRELVELVTDYLEAGLSAQDRARFEAHIARCPHCTGYVEQMRLTLAVVGEIDSGGLSEDLERNLLDAFRDWKAGAGGPGA